MKFEEWYKKHKKAIMALKRSFERDTGTKIALKQFGERMYRETKYYKR